MNVASAGMSAGYVRLQFQTKLPESAHRDADRNIANSLRSDHSFMAELKRLGLYDEDAASVIEDSEVLEA